MTTLYLVRHGQTEWNVEQRMQGWADAPLTALGLQQARQLAKRLHDVHLDAIYASPSGRAMDTARIACGAHEVAITPDDDLREINLGAWEGRLLAEVQQAWPQQFAAFQHAAQRYRPVGGETFMQVRERALRAIERIVAAHVGGTVLVVTHTVTLKLVLAYCEARQVERLWDPPYIHEASLSVVRLGEGAPQVLVCGDISHLEP